jgi:hypothetical protein
MILENKLEMVEKKEEAIVCAKIISGYSPWKEERSVSGKSWNIESPKCEKLLTT